MTEQMKHIPLTIRKVTNKHWAIISNDDGYAICSTETKEQAEFLITACNAHDELLKVAKFAEYVAGHGYVGLQKKKDVEKQLVDMAKAAIALVGVKES